MTTAALLNVHYLDETDPAALYHRYDGQQSPQGVYLELILDTGDMTIKYNDEPGNGRPMGVHHGRIRRYDLAGVPTTADANLLLKAAIDDAENILSGATVERTSSGDLEGWLDEDAADVEDELRILVESWDSKPVREMTAEELWSVPGADEPEITADTTDAEIAEMVAAAEAEVADAAPQMDYHPVLTGARDFLAHRREVERMEVRNQLSNHTRAHRDALIRQVRSFGDSLETIGELAGMSAPGVKKIVDKDVPVPSFVELARDHGVTVVPADATALFVATALITPPTNRRWFRCRTCLVIFVLRVGEVATVQDERDAAFAHEAGCEGVNRGK